MCPQCTLVSILDICSNTQLILLVGSLDPYLHGNIALYNVCDPDSAFIFDHAKGHTLPREKHMVKELGDTVRRMMAEVTDGNSPP